jgi:hypothetical protein
MLKKARRKRQLYQLLARLPRSGLDHVDALIGMEERHAARRWYYLRLDGVRVML